MSDITISCLSLCLQMLRSLNKVPALNKPLPDIYTLKHIEIPPNKLVSRIMTQLYDSMMSYSLERTNQTRS
jgi:hypothetical protein